MALENGHIQGTEFTYGSSILYSCTRGYNLEGPSRRTCVISGWTGSQPKCNRKFPKNLFDPQFIVKHFLFAFLSNLYNFISFPQLFSIFFTAITCHDPGALTHGQRSTNVNFTFGTVLTYTCDVGYTIKGSSSSTCRIDGLWSNRKPECERMYSTLRLSENPY